HGQHQEVPPIPKSLLVHTLRLPKQHCHHNRQQCIQHQPGPAKCPACCSHHQQRSKRKQGRDQVCRRNHFRQSYSCQLKTPEGTAAFRPPPLPPHQTL